MKMEPGDGNFLHEHPAGTAGANVEFSGGAEKTIRFKGTTAETKDNTPVFKWGEHETEADIPVRVKTMKRRTVKVMLHKIQLTARDGTPIPLDEADFLPSTPAPGRSGAAVGGTNPQLPVLALQEGLFQFFVDHGGWLVLV